MFSGSPRLCFKCVNIDIRLVSLRCVQVFAAHKPFDPVTSNSPCADFVDGKKSEILLPHSFPVTVWNEFISCEEEDKLMGILDPKLQKQKYSQSHFDSVICNFREQLLPMWAVDADEFLSDIIKRVVNQICAEGTKLEDVHVLDIAEDGFIAPHVDTEFTGGIVAGLTLLSDAVITFQPHKPELQESLLQKKENYDQSTSTNKLALNSSIIFSELPRVDLLVPARSLYLITQEARYNWTHAIELQAKQTFKGNHIPRSRRISLMFRDELPQSDTPKNKSGSLADFV